MIDQLASFGSRRALGKVPRIQCRMEDLASKGCVVMLLIQKDEYESKHCDRQMRQSVVVHNGASMFIT
ncbi:hypothetical protein T4E_9410 [Trichinella pseudospiralis]|uniref:Uncharacterized protein n=1 Tax=Trichinella pseudospiralis TaxID=6337 RepID=A0A0V0YFR6_TRIPS|nr:hypothetical protein T4E_9410 [Trichinella pseudospiralis]